MKGTLIVLFLNKMKNDAKNLSIDCILLCFLAFVIILIWFRTGLPIARGEAGMPFEHPSRLVYHAFFTWSDIEATGLPRSIAHFPFQAIMYAFYAIGFSSVLRQAITFFFLLGASGSSMYCLTHFLITDEKQRLASLCAGIIYMINPFTLYAWHRLHSIIFFLPFIPLICLMYLRGLNDKKNLWRNALFVNLVVALSLAAFLNPTYLLSCVLILAILFCFYMLQNLKNVHVYLHGIKFTTATALLGILLNLWWLLPILPTFSSTLESAASIAPLPTLKILSSNYFQVTYIIRLFESNTYSLLPFNSDSLLMLLTFIPCILAFSALLLEKRSKNVLFFSLLALIGIFLCTGSNPPFGDLFVSLFQAFPLSAGFRNPYDKFGMILMLSYSFLIGVSISSICCKILGKFKRNYRHVPTVLGLILLLLVITPSGISIFSGTVFSPEGSVTGDPTKIAEYYTTIPSYYQEANDWLSEQNDVFKIISFPISPNDFLAYYWENGYSGTAPWNLWNNPIIMSRTWYNDVDKMSKQLSLALTEGNQFWKIMSILNAKYAVVQNDYVYWREFEIQAGYPQSSEYYLTNLQYPEIPDYANAQRLQIEKKHVPDYDNSIKLSTNETNWKEIGIAQHQITSANVTLTGDDTIPKIISLIEGDLSWEGGIECDFEYVQNMSKYDFISFWVKFESLDSIGRVYFGVEDVNSNYKKWEITDQVADSWTRITVPLNSTGLWQSPTDLDLTLMKALQVTIEKKQGAMNQTVWWLGCIEAMPKMVIEQETSLSNWTPVMIPYHNISLDNLTLVENQTTTKIISQMDGDLEWEGGVVHYWEAPKNLTGYDYVSFWISFESLDSIGRVYFGLEDVNSNYKKWEITDQVADSWTRITIPLNSTGLWQSTQILDLSSIAVATFSIEKKHGEMDTTIWWLGSLQAVPKKILTQMHISKSETFGDLVFFEIEEEFFSPVIYATPQYNFVSDLETMINCLMTTSVDPRNTTLFLDSQLSEKDVQFINALTLSEQIPELAFEKINPTKYTISVENSTGAFFLVFSSTFDNNWDAYVNDQRIPDGYHFEANGYANVWYIDKTGTYTITLEFWSQKLFYVGVIISCATLVLCTVYVRKGTIKIIYLKYVKKQNTPSKTKSC